MSDKPGRLHVTVPPNTKPIPRNPSFNSPLPTTALPTEPAPSIIGRERALVDALTKALLDAARQRHDYMPASETRRGSSFLLSLRDPDDEPTGCTVRVNVEMLPPGPSS